MTIADALDLAVDAAKSAVSGGTVGRVLGVLAIAFATLQMSRLTRRALRGALDRARVDQALGVIVDRVTQAVILVAGVSWGLDMFGLHLGTVGAILGISGVALGLALQDVLKQLVAGAYLLVGRPFTAGDRVTVEAGSGVVRKVGLLDTVIDADDGGALVVPNAWFLTHVTERRGLDATVYVRLDVTIRTGAAVIADPGALGDAIGACLASCGSVLHDDGTARVRAWTIDGPVVRIQCVASDRSVAVDEIIWALRSRLGEAVVDVRDA